MWAIPCLETAHNVYWEQTSVMHREEMGMKQGAGQAVCFVQQICSVWTAEIAEIHLQNSSIVCHYG